MLTYPAVWDYLACPVLHESPFARQTRHIFLASGGECKQSLGYSTHMYTSTHTHELNYVFCVVSSDCTLLLFFAIPGLVEADLAPA